MLNEIKNPDLSFEQKIEKANEYADTFGMDENNRKGLQAFATSGLDGMMAHMIKESGGDYATMMAMYH